MAENANDVGGFATSTVEVTAYDYKNETEVERLGITDLISLINVAQELDGAGRKLDAIALYRQWIATNDSNMVFAAHFNKGVLLSQAGDLQESEMAFRASIAARPGFIEAHVHLAALLETSGRKQLAVAHWFDILQNFLPTSTEERELVSLAASKTRMHIDSVEKMHIGWLRTTDQHTQASADQSEAGAQPAVPISFDTQADENPADRRYVIVAPPYQHNSAGIRVLYELQKRLVKAGLDAIVCTWFNGYPVKQFEDDIVIYPEVAPGNLLNAKRVIRYILNVPGKLGYGEKTYAPNEILVAYNKELASYSNGFILQVPSIEPFFYENKGQKSLDAVFVGKGRDLGLHPPCCVAITKSYPATRRGVANLLRSVNTLYMYDDFSMLSREAQLCGCSVKLICVDGKIVDYPMHEYPSDEEFQVQLQAFIDLIKSL